MGSRGVVAARVGASVLVAGLLLAFSAPARAEANEALWSLLRGGGQVVMIRHAATDRSIGDPPNFRLDDCSTQRNLSDAGRADAMRIGAAFRARQIPVGRVLSSQWCRCLETARLAFGVTELWEAVNSTFRDKSLEPERTRRVRELLAERPAQGNLVLVTHQLNIGAAVGVYPAEGELVVVTPLGSGFRVAGRIPPSGLD